ncbi:MAG TPA: ATP-binding cassette domain-containing protein [Gammaproteobacteria bacterium]|nr:ATP-binding cassette domain-containing protein [Gammaproteobacteria bacterium]
MTTRARPSKLKQQLPSSVNRQTHEPATALRIQQLHLNLDGNTILQQVNLNLPRQGMTSVIGPSGAGKSSLLRCINGLHQDWRGQIDLNSQNIRHWKGGWEQLRKQIGLIPQKPCVFPQSIRSNITFGLSRKQSRNSAPLEEQTLRQAALWDEVKDRLDSPAEQLSLGQQQRLSIARALAIKPQVLLLDEPTASLDPRSKQLIEQSILQLAETMPVLCVTHDLAQAQRFGGQVIFMCDGKVIEQGACQTFFKQPQKLESKEFLRWSVCDCD